MPNAGTGDRGQYAASPYAMSWRAWRQVLLRVKDQLGEDNVSIISAGVAFYGFLAVFPAMIALILIYGLFADPGDVQDQLASYRELVPAAAFDLLAKRMRDVAAANQTGLSIGAVFSIGLALWSAKQGITALMTAIGIAYEQADRRNWFVRTALALVFTVGAIFFIIAALALIAAIPAAVAFLDPPPPVGTVLLWARWLVLAVLVMVALGILFRYAPHRRPARLAWITPGALASGVLWLILSVAFSVYVQNFGSYDKTFGSIAAVVVLLLWFYWSAFVVCIGAELNAELEMQTYRDSTVGPAHRAGRRGAYVADHTRGEPN